MNTQIIQLQETEGVGSVNGTWTNVVPTDLFLEEGDELNIKQAFIETSSKISITDTVTAILHFTPYFVNHDDGYTAVADELLREYEKKLPNGDAEAQPNNAMYIACNKKDPPPGGEQYELLKVYTLYGNYGVTVHPAEDWVIRFSYVDVNEVTQTIIQPTKPSDLKAEGIDPSTKELHYDSRFTFNLLSKKGSFKDMSSSANKSRIGVRNHINPIYRFKDEDIETIDADEAYTPLEFTQSVDIPPGEYDPDDLAHILTTGLNKIQSNNISQLTKLPLANPINNNLFTTLTQQNQASNQTKCKYVSTTGDDICQFLDSAPNRFMGAENFSIEYGEQNGISKFLISNMHSPVYVSNKPGLKIQQPGKTGTDVNIIGVSNGILLTKMEPETFWYDKLGFDGDCIYIPSHTKTTIAGIERITPAFSPDINVDNLITQQYCGLDFLLNKGITEAESGFSTGSTYNVPNAVATPFIDSDEVQPIFAANVASATSINPYYLINVDCMRNDLKGNKVVKTLSCVTGNYYNAGAYVLSQPADSIPYIHHGLPVPISNIGISILSESGSHPAIGKKNHVFLELNKNPQNNPINKKQSSKK